MPVTLDSKEFANFFYDILKEQHDNPEKFRGIHTGIPELDELTGGLRKGWYIVIGGPQKSGKTAMMLTILMQLAMHKMKFMWVSLEMGMEMMGGRAFANLVNKDSSVNLTKFRDVDLHDDDWKEVERIKALVETFGGYWVTGTRMIEDILKEATEKEVEVLVIDYAQLISAKNMKGQAGSVAEDEYISNLMKAWTLEGVSKENMENRMLITGSQLNREGTKNERFDSPDFHKNSSSYVQDADLAFNIAPVKNDVTNEIDPTRRKIHVVASRISDTGSTFYVTFEGAHSRFSKSEQPLTFTEVSEKELAKPISKPEVKQDPLDNLIPEEKKAPEKKEVTPF